MLTRRCSRFDNMVLRWSPRTPVAVYSNADGPTGAETVAAILELKYGKVLLLKS